jgi:tetratricopeptide (TPR) repeat protein
MPQSDHPTESLGSDRTASFTPKAEAAPPRQRAFPQGLELKPIWIGAVLGGVVVIVLIFWYFSSSPLERNFDDLLSKNSLPSAYDVYQRAVSQEGASSRIVNRMREKAKAPLQRVCDELFSRWYNEGDIRPYNWDAVLKMQTWLAEIQPNPEYQARVSYANGQVLQNLGRFNEALNQNQNALLLKPNWSLALNGVAKACVRLNDNSCAEAYYRKATQSDPQWLFPYQNLAGVLMKLGRYSEAETYYQQAISISPQRASSHFLLGQMYQQHGKMFYANACAEYQKSLQLSSGGSFDIEWVKRQIQKVCKSF